MNTINDWQKEFPNLYKLFKKPLTFLADIPVGLDKWIKKFVFWGTVVLMAYLFYFHTNQYFQTNDLLKMTNYFSNTDYGTRVWMGYRNFFYGFLALDILLSALVIVISVFRKNFAKIVAVSTGWLALVLFVTFSYALTELISKSIVWFMTF